MKRFRVVALVLSMLSAPAAWAQAAGEPAHPRFDAELARSVGADDMGMKGYVLVILKTGPQRVPAGPERDEMFKGHFANINRLAQEGKLVLAGPLDGVDGWRGLFVLATSSLDEARQMVATDPVVAKGEMVPEMHRFYGSAALTLMRDLHERVSRKQP